MPDQGQGVVVGLHNGGTANNATVLDSAGRFLVDHMLETRSLVQEGPEKAIEALASAFTGVLGHIRIPTDGMLGPGQPVPVCNCGLPGDAESFASLTGIAKNLLPYWLTRFPGHELGQRAPAVAARLVRALGEAGDPLALEIFGQQAAAIGRLLSIAANFSDPHTYFLGGGVVEASPAFRDWFLAKVRGHQDLREEQWRAAAFALVPDLDMAGARGA